MNILNYKDKNIMDEKIKKAIDMHQTANREILKEISDIVEQHPELRFGQILTILGIVPYTDFIDGERKLFAEIDPK